MNLSNLKIALLEAKRQRKIASPHKGTLGNQYVKWDNEVAKLQSQIDNYGILCRGCAAFHTCKLEKKGTALKCRNHWEHLNCK